MYPNFFAFTEVLHLDPIFVDKLFEVVVQPTGAYA
jgi:hypothetical protein